MASRAMAHRATEICSPVDSSISISRLEALGLISSALAIRSSVVSPWAESTTITSLPRQVGLGDDAGHVADALGISRRCCRRISVRSSSWHFLL